MYKIVTNFAQNVACCTPIRGGCKNKFYMSHVRGTNIFPHSILKFYSPPPPNKNNAHSLKYIFWYDSSHFLYSMKLKQILSFTS